VAAWFRERIDFGPVIAFARKKTVPMHRHSWIYLLGGAALFLFLLQVLTGSLLMLYYQPGEASAHESVERIMNEVPYGWLIRSTHAWGAHFFIGVVCLHLLTVLFTRAYRKPRELTWVSGALMLLLALGFGFSGYLLPWNKLSYYATRVGTSMAGSFPVISDPLQQLLRGGDTVTGDTITRFFAAHVMIVPLAFGFLLLVHLALIQAQGMSLPLGTRQERVRDHRPFFGEFLLWDVSLWLVLFGVIVTLAVIMPTEVGVKPNPLEKTPAGIKPEWYFLFMFQTLKFVPKIVGVLSFALLGLLLLVLPFLDKTSDRGRASRRWTAAFLAVLAYVAVFQVWALLTPGTEHPHEELTAETYNLWSAAVSLVLLWAVIGFLVFYLRKLVDENARVRKLHAGTAE
jgi:cytochrome b6